MNLKEYLESDKIDFQLHENTIENYKKLFSKDKGIRSFFTSYAAYIINYTEKTSMMISVFEENFHELKAFKITSEYYGFEFKVSLLDFVNASKKDNIIQTLKFQITMEKVLKKDPAERKASNYADLINEDSIINEAKQRYQKYLTLREFSKPIILSSKE